MSKLDEHEQLLSRRGFMKGASIVAGGALVGPLISTAAASTKQSTGGSSVNAKLKTVNMDNVKGISPVSEPGKYDYKTDVLVIGFGVGGTMAALVASNHGAKVTVLEKLTRDKWDEHCGVQVLSGLGGEDWSKVTGKPWTEKDKEAAAYELWMNNDYQADYRLLRQMTEEWPTPIDELRKIGLKFMPVDLGDSFVGRMKIKYPAIRYTSVNTDQQDFTPMDPWINKYHCCEVTIERHLKGKGAELLFGAENTRLIVNSAGRVVGARAVIGGKTVNVNAKATILATGGYGANYDMIKYYGWVGDVCGCHVGSRSNQGDGIRMGQGIGADTMGLPGCSVADGGPDTVSKGLPWNFRNTAFYKDRTVSGYGEAAIQLARQPMLKVNETGLRFMDENETWKAKNLVASVQPNMNYFTIYDADIEGAINFIKGSRYGMCENMLTPDFRIFFEDDDIRPLWSWKNSMEWCKKTAGNIFTANTLEELASEAGINRTQFVEQVRRYNHFCETGVDEEFGKHKSFLFPVKKPPFLALKTKPSFLWVTLGGLRINTKWQVIKPNGEIIPGLYGGSSDVGGLSRPSGYGCENEYQPAGSAAISGSISGRNAAAEALGKV